jgi:hypothetical protein
MKPRNNFLEQLERRRREATKASEPSHVEKPIAEMSEAELETALAEAKRELLDATRAETRARTLTNLEDEHSKPKRHNFSELKKKRPRWR